mmetsp:Transcript_4281/g.9615  ORF Transcript_4281/g.9615 Transcript_4281/m.9615 type:complete len:238 (-) Transcript_4281:1276-1989(-)
MGVTFLSKLEKNLKNSVYKFGPFLAETHVNTFYLAVQGLCCFRRRPCPCRGPYHCLCLSPYHRRPRHRPCIHCLPHWHIPTLRWDVGPRLRSHRAHVHSLHLGRIVNRNILDNNRLLENLRYVAQLPVVGLDGQEVEDVTGDGLRQHRQVHPTPTGEHRVQVERGGVDVLGAAPGGRKNDEIEGRRLLRTFPACPTYSMKLWSWRAVSSRVGTCATNRVHSVGNRVGYNAASWCLSN